MSPGFRVSFTLIVTGLMFLQFATMIAWVAVDVFPGLSCAEGTMNELQCLPFRTRTCF